MNDKTRQCKNCKYLGDEIFALSDGTDEYVDERPLAEYQPTGFHCCDFVKHKNCVMGGRDEFPKDEIVGVEDGSGYFARLVVKGEFGCVEWCARDGEDQG